MPVNWKTKLPAIGSLIAVVGEFVHDPNSFNWGVNLPIIISAVGLLFAKQHNVTGGTVSNATGGTVQQ